MRQESRNHIFKSSDAASTALCVNYACAAANRVSTWCPWDLSGLEGPKRSEHPQEETPACNWELRRGSKSAIQRNLVGLLGRVLDVQLRADQRWIHRRVGCFQNFTAFGGIDDIDWTAPVRVPSIRLLAHTPSAILPVMQDPLVLSPSLQQDASMAAILLTVRQPPRRKLPASSPKSTPRPHA